MSKGTGNAVDFFSGKKTLTEDSFFKEETEDSTKGKWKKAREWMEEWWEGIIAYKCPHRDTFQNIVRE